MTFEQQIAAFIKKAKENPEKLSRQVSIKLFSAVILATPVDTGRLRMNWQAAGDSPASGNVSGTDTSGGLAIRNTINFVNNDPNWKVFTLANNLPYAQKIEYGGYPGNGPNTIGGYSKQAPAGMVRINVSRFQRLINDALRDIR